MATYNTGSVERVVAVYNAAPSLATNVFTTLFQAAPIPTITRISGTVQISVNGAFFGFLQTQNNIATGIGWFYNSSASTGLSIQAFNTSAPFSSAQADPSGVSSGPGVFGYRNSLVFNDFIVPPGFFVQFRGQTLTTTYPHTLTRVETTLT